MSSRERYRALPRNAQAALPAYALGYLGLALAYGLTPLPRLRNSPLLAFVDDQVSLRGWAALFAVITLGIVAGFVIDRVWIVKFALLLAVVGTGFFCAYSTAAIFAAGAPPSSVAWCVFPIGACLATYRTL